MIFPVLDTQLEAVVVDQRVEQSQRLIELAVEVTLDAAFLSVPDRKLLPRDAVVRTVGQDELVFFLPADVTLDGPVASALRGAVIVFATYNEALDALHSEILAMDAVARTAATPATAIAMARRSKLPAAVPRSTTLGQLLPGERVIEAEFRHRPVISVVSGQYLARPIANVLRDVRTNLGLRPARRRP